MKRKPSHLTEDFASQWEDAGMASAYPCRPPYPDGVFEALVELAGDGRVLDIGCGTGDIARPLAARGVTVDACDRSLAMVACGRTRPSGGAVRWMVGRAEQPPVLGPYALVTAGECIHWMDWERLFAPLRRLAPVVALAFRAQEPEPWSEELLRLIPRYSTNFGYEPYDLVEELESRGLFAPQGTKRTGVMEFSQTIEEYIGCIHSRNGFSRARMGGDVAAEFDGQVRELVSPFAVDGSVTLKIRGTVTWG